jgi:hypothetical protein
MCPGLRIDGDMHRGGPVCRRDPGGDVFARIDRDGKGRPERGGVFNGLLRQLQLFHSLRGEGEADQTPGMLGHEIDGMRGHLFRRNDEVAFIFPVFIVHQDDELALFDVADGVFDTIERAWHNAQRSR